jgi:hypothetical protein
LDEVDLRQRSTLLTVPKGRLIKANLDMGLGVAQVHGLLDGVESVRDEIRERLLAFDLGKLVRMRGNAATLGYLPALGRQALRATGPVPECREA